MDHLLKPINDMRSQGLITVVLDEIERYIISGEDRILERFTLDFISQNWLCQFSPHILPPDQLTEADRRVLKLLIKGEADSALWRWIYQCIITEPDQEDRFSACRSTLLALGLPESRLQHIVVDASSALLISQNLKSIARYLLGFTLDELKAAAAGDPNGSIHGALLFFLLHGRKDQVLVVLKQAMAHPQNSYWCCELLAQYGGKEYEEQIAATYEATTGSSKLNLADTVCKINRERFGPQALRIAEEHLLNEPMYESIAASVLISFPAETVIPIFNQYCALPVKDSHASAQRIEVLKTMTSRFKADALPAIRAAIKNTDPLSSLAAVECGLSFPHESLHTDMIESITRGLSQEPRVLAKYVPVAMKVDAARFASALHELLEHKSKPVREAAAVTLGKQGNQALDKARNLLAQKNRQSRTLGVLMAAAAATPEAIELLQEHFQKETDDDVRDAALTGLKEAGVDIRAFLQKHAATDRDTIRVAAAKIHKMPVTWINPDDLPPLPDLDGQPLSADEVRYLLYRQARQEECGPDPEIFALYAAVDRKHSGDFALKILTLFSQSGGAKKDAWALVIAGMLGDARVISALSSMVRQWADDGDHKLGQWGVEALALHGSDAALSAVESIVTRYASSQKRKHRVVADAAQKALQSAAQRLGISLDELGDRIVPWLGFEPVRPRIIDCGGRTLQAQIGLDFKLHLKDAQTGKRAVSIPKSAPADIQAEFKGLSTLVRDIGKAQTRRLENLMVIQHRWPSARWQELFLQHPILFPFAVQLIWGIYDADHRLAGTFRALEDRSLTDAADETVAPPAESRIGIVHPIELSADDLAAWQTHQADYELEQPFPQLQRLIARMPAELAGEKSFTGSEGTQVAVLAARGRGQKRGWVVTSMDKMGMRKSFAHAGIDAFVEMDGLDFAYYGDPSQQVKLGKLQFFESSQNAANAEQAVVAPPAISLGKIPPIVYSEAVGDVLAISGGVA